MWWRRRQKKLWEVQDEERCEVLGFEHDMAVAPVHSQINQTCTRPLRDPALQHAIMDGEGASKAPPSLGSSRQLTVVEGRGVIVPSGLAMGTLPLHR